MAATAGSEEFVDPQRYFPTLMVQDNVGLSLTNGSLDQAVHSNLTLIQTLVEHWNRPAGSLIGAFYSPDLTPDVPPADYHPTGRSAIDSTNLLTMALKAGLRPIGVELDVTLTRKLPPTGSPLSSGQLVDVQHAIADVKRLTGARQVLVWFTPNNGIYGDFAHDAIFANQRAAALLAGGIAMDVPAALWQIFPPGYRNTLISMLTWTKNHHIDTLFAVSPYADGALPVKQWNYDPRFLENTRKIMKDLAAAHVWPSSWMVQNYTPPAAPGNRPGRDTDPQSISGVALWVARHACFPDRPLHQ